MALIESEKEKGDGFGEGTGWDDPIAVMLEGMLLDNMRLVFQNAIEEIVQWGYEEAVVEKALSRRGLFAGSKDPVMSIVNFTLNLLWIGEKVDGLMDFEFDNIQHLIEYTLVEMLGVLREIRPFLSIGEAMWWLLICDLNVMQACRLEEDSLSGSRRERSSEKSSSEIALSQLKSKAQDQLMQTLTFQDFLKRLAPKDPHSAEWTTKEDDELASMFRKMEDFWGCYGETGMGKSQAFALGESSRAGSGKRGHSKRELTRLVQQRCYIERSCMAHGSKGLIGSAKLASDGGVHTDSKLKCSCGSALSLKIDHTKKTTCFGGKAHLSNDKRKAAKASSNMPSTSPGTANASKLCKKGTTAPNTKPDLKSFICSTSSSELADYCAEIPYDSSSGNYLPRNKKDELVLKLVLQLQGLQGELKNWTEWANQKVMQAARKLGKVQPELKTMKQLMEAAKKSIEESNARRLTILENSVNGINSLVEKGNFIICKLEEENSRMKKELEAAKSKASESSIDYQAALEREQKAKHEIQSWDGEIGLLQKELETEKKKLLALQQDSVKANNDYNKMEVRLEGERNETQKLLAKAALIKKEREQLQLVAKAEFARIQHKAKTVTQKSMEDLGKLQSLFSQAQSRSEAATIAALRRGTSGGLGKHLMNTKGFATMVGNQNFLDHYGSKGLNRERECVMCLSEEMSVVFIPCSHQVLCGNCNELHEKRGMKDCPSCRTPIQRRIKVRFANP